MLLAFSKSLYLREAIDRAAAAYAGHLTVQIEDAEGNLVIHTAGDEPGQEILDNFANHVLFETVRLRKAQLEGRS